MTLIIDIVMPKINSFKLYEKIKKIDDKDLFYY